DCFAMLAMTETSMRPLHAIARPDTKLRRAAAADLEHRRGRLTRRKRSLVERLGVGDPRDPPIGADKDDIEWNERVLHPEGDLLGRVVREDHPAVTRERLHEHEPALLLLGRGGDLDHEAVIAVRRMNRQRYLHESGLGALFSRHILRRRLRAAGDQRNRKYGS